MSEAALFTLRDLRGWLADTGAAGAGAGSRDERGSAAGAGKGAGVGADQVGFSRVCTDTRSVRTGDLFVALRGEKFDANDFALQAEQAGAAALVVERPIAGTRVPTIVVADGRAALGAIARGWRSRFTLPVIAVTGSNGKTTVKEMIAAILTQAFGAEHTLATPGNLNNDVGVPLAVLGLREQHRAAVFELGMNRPGEIDALARIAAPRVALVNNAQREHQEFMASVEATAHENGAVLSVLEVDGVAVYPGDDVCTPIWRSLAGAHRRIEFGFDAALPVHAAPSTRPPQVAFAIDGRGLTLELAIAGQHNVRNAMAAAACCSAIGIDDATIARGLAAFRPVKGRLAGRRLDSGALLIDDSYNANPDSVRAAIDVLADASTRKILVLGDMGEVGDQGPAFHAEVGGYARERGVDHLLSMGDATRDSVNAFGAAGEHFTEVESLVARLRVLLAGHSATVLIKGSRFMRMERVVAALTGTAAVGGAH